MYLNLLTFGNFASAVNNMRARMYTCLALLSIVVCRLDCERSIRIDGIYPKSSIFYNR